MRKILRWNKVLNAILWIMAALFVLEGVFKVYQGENGLMYFTIGVCMVPIAIGKQRENKRREEIMKQQEGIENEYEKNERNV